MGGEYGICGEAVIELEWHGGATDGDRRVGGCGICFGGWVPGAGDLKPVDPQITQILVDEGLDFGDIR